MTTTLDSGRIFEPYCTVGLTCDKIPFTFFSSAEQQDSFVITSVGHCIHSYRCSSLRMVSRSDNLKCLSNENISDKCCEILEGNAGAEHSCTSSSVSALANNNTNIFVASGNLIRILNRGRSVKSVLQQNPKSIVTQMISFGTDHLISLDQQSTVTVWNHETQQIYLELKFDSENFDASTMIQPATYVNKILIGSKQGLAKIWNVKHNRHVYDFKFPSSIVCFSQSPAVDILAIGFSDGVILIHNIKSDVTLFSFSQESSVTSLSYQWDQPKLASCGSDGSIAIWDLEERKLSCEIRSAHDANSDGISSCQFLPGQPILVTSGGDNAIRMWIFDGTDSSGRLLRQRCGHPSSVSAVRIYKRNGLLSTSGEGFQRWFIEHGSCGSYMGSCGMSDIFDFAVEPSSESKWENLVALHRGTNVVSTWSVGKMSHGSCITPTTAVGNATACDISSCGDFVVIGYDSGDVILYSLQSKQQRRVYQCPKRPERLAVKGVAIDGLNQFLFTGDVQGNLCAFHFYSQTLLKEKKIDSINFFRLHRANNFLAVSVVTKNIVLIDAMRFHIIRTFSGHLSPVTCIRFSFDGRWLLSSSLDCTLKVWDVASGSLIDVMLLEDPVVSFDISKDILVCAHQGCMGLNIYSNKSLYEPITLRTLEPTYIPALNPVHDTTDELDNADTGELIGHFVSTSQISEKLITLSLLPESQWKSLLNIDVIKSRNKPTAPPNKLESAPFFLPSIPSTSGFKFIEPAEDNALQTNNKWLFTDETEITFCLRKKNYEKLDVLLKEMGPANVDFEIHNLLSDHLPDRVLSESFINYLSDKLYSNKDFEYISSLLALFIRIHGEKILLHFPKQFESLALLADAQALRWSALGQSMELCLSIVRYLKSIAVR